MTTINGHVTGTNWQTPTFWNAKETSAQIQLASNNSLGALTTGNPIVRAIVPSTNQSKFIATKNEEIVLGKDTEIIVFAKKTTSNATQITSVLRWEEEF